MYSRQPYTKLLKNRCIFHTIMWSHKNALPSFLIHATDPPCCDPCDPCGTGSGGSGASGGGGGKHKLTFKPYVPPCKQDHDHKNMKLRRPMSPHLQIYEPTLPAMTSITQRITGSILSFYAIMLGGGALFAPNGINSYISMIQSLNLSSTSVLVLKFLLGLPFAYHYFVGIRFCIWNAGKMMSLDAIYKSAYLAILAAGGLAVFFACL